MAAETPAAALPERASGEDIADRHAVGALVRQALARLPRQQRAVLVLRYCEDLPEAEFARLLGCSPDRSKPMRTGVCARSVSSSAVSGHGPRSTRHQIQGVTGGERIMKEPQMSDTEQEVRTLFASAAEDIPPGIDLLRGVKAQRAAHVVRVRAALSAAAVAVVAVVTLVTLTVVQAPSALAQLTSAVSRMTAGKSYHFSATTTTWRCRPMARQRPCGRTSPGRSTRREESARRP